MAAVVFPEPPLPKKVTNLVDLTPAASFFAATTVKIKAPFFFAVLLLLFTGEKQWKSATFGGEINDRARRGEGETAIG